MRTLFFLWLLGSVVLVQARDTPSIFELNQRLGRGINFGNALEAPSEGEWGMRLEPDFFELVKDAGFDTIRLPVSWTHHAYREAPYTIDPEFMTRVRWAVSHAVARGLNIIVNVHHYDELNQDPRAEEARYLAIWQKIAEEFKDQPNTVYFELLNEPHGAFNNDVALWNQLLVKALDVVRQSNPERAVIVGPTNWNSIASLGQLELPDDPNLIVTVHFYDPFEFTHQGAEWVNPSPPVGTTWTGGNRRISPRWRKEFTNTQAEFVTNDGRETLQVQFETGDAEFKLHSVIGPRGFTQLALQTDRGVDFRMVCNENENQPIDVSTEAGVETILELSDCGSPERMIDIALQNASGEPQTFLLEVLEFRGNNKVLTPFDDDGTAIRERLDEAAEWSEKHNRPIFLGEFGAYSKADYDSRVLWTAFVRSEAEKRGFSWAYWEFGAGFGIYDRETKQWREELLNALIEP